MSPIRLNKLLAERGLGARRKCDALIKEGHVRVNGEPVLEPGVRVEPEHDRVTVNGRPLPAQEVLRYYLLHKPVGVITTLHDPEGRRTIRDFMPPRPRLFPVGRLDADTSGLLLLTNDGELAHHLMHPRYGVMKVYRVRLAGTPSPNQLTRLRHGVEFEPRVWSAPASVRMVSAEAGRAMIEIELHEGRYRQVRRMCEAVGLTVLGLHRAAYGPLRLGALARGMSRELAEREVGMLRAASARPKSRPRSRSHGEFVDPRSSRARARAERARLLETRESARAKERADQRSPRSRGPRVRASRPGEKRPRADHRSLIIERPRPAGDASFERSPGPRRGTGERMLRRGEAPFRSDRRGGPRPPRRGEAPIRTQRRGSSRLLPRDQAPFRSDRRGGPRPPRRGQAPIRSDRRSGPQRGVTGQTPRRDGWVFPRSAPRRQNGPQSGRRERPRTPRSRPGSRPGNH